MSDFNASGPRSTLIAVRALPTGPMMAGALLVGALLIHGVSPAEAADRRGQPSVVATGAATARSATAAIATPFRTIVQSLNQLKESAARSRGAQRKGRKTRRAKQRRGTKPATSAAAQPAATGNAAAVVTTTTGTLVTGAAPSASPATAASAPPAAKSGTPAPGHWPVVPQSARDDTWSPQEVAAAKAHCATVLKGLNAIVTETEAMREGSCGSAAPVTLVSLGKRSNLVTFDPPPTINCDMVRALSQWLDVGLQPLAKQVLATRVASVKVMSSYSCRKVAGRNRLSEHAMANALDIAGFGLADGETVSVLDDWGPNGRDIAEKIAQARQDAARKVRAVAEANKARSKALQAKAKSAKPRDGETDAPRAATEAVATATSGRPAADNSVPLPTRKSTSALTLGPPPAAVADSPATALVPSATRGLPGGRLSGFGFTPPSRLGGPKPRKSVDPEARRRFLREAHVQGCRAFSTILGPEANEAHRNHFHVDLSPRRSGKYCE